MSAPNNNPPSAKQVQKKKERAVAFIVVRLSSLRLPGKQFRLIGDRPLLQWIIDHLRACEELDDIVIATVAEKENEPLRKFAHDQGVKCFWYQGEVDHVTTRLRRAAEEFNADICVLVSGDCPLIYAPSVDYLVREIRQDPDADRVVVETDEEGNPPALEGVGVARKRAWQRADDLSDRPELREHQFPIIGQRPDMFKAHRCWVPKDLYDPFHHRFSVDTQADLEFMNELHRVLTSRGRPFTLADALDALGKHPELLDINRHVHQMGVGEERKNVLMIVDAGDGFGYGHFMRCRELALQVTERLGWPAAFSVKDEHAKHILKETGIRTINEAQSSKFKIQGMAEEDNSPMFQIPEFLDPFDLIILDIYYRRDLGTGWRQMFPLDSRVVVLDHVGNWTKEADLVVIPGVTYDDSIDIKNDGHSRVIVGKQYVILRREIRKLKHRHIKKDIDLLAYLYSSGQKEAVRNLAGKNGFNIHVIEDFESDFAELLARSRIFLSGFGYSFYEALSLGAYPITLPLSDTHKTDAKKFYDRLGIPCGILKSVEELGNALNNLVKQENTFENLRIDDGTPRIVEEIASLLKTEQR